MLPGREKSARGTAVARAGRLVLKLLIVMSVMELSIVAAMFVMMVFAMAVVVAGAAAAAVMMLDQARLIHGRTGVVSRGCSRFCG